jgi:nitronate monooxygenase
MTGSDDRAAFLRKLGIAHPILLAPMAGGAGTPELVAAVSNAGGLGSFGGAYSTPEQILEAAKKIRVLTDKPFGINLFAGGYEPHRRVDPAPMMKLMNGIHAELGLPPPVLPPNPASPFDDQLAAVIEARPAVFSFTFGIPEPDVLARLRKRGILLSGTATTLQEARALQEAGVDSIMAQGEEAGAHRGTFLASFEDSMVPMRDLVRSIAGAVSVPVIASGAIMHGRDIAETFRLGAAAAQLGTAFLPCPECGTPETHKKALLAARADTTVITRAFSGRHARGLRNAFIDRAKPETILPFRQQNDLTRPMRNAAGQKGRADYLSLWAGRGVTRSRALPAAELVKTLLVEIAGA